MAGSWVTDTTHLPDEYGNIPSESGLAFRFAKFLASIISLVTHPEPVPVSFDVPCRRRPNRKPCNGFIEGSTDPDTNAIVWWCPECGDHGFINNWQDTIWDMSGAGDLVQ